MSELRDHLQDLLTDAVHYDTCATVLIESPPWSASWRALNCTCLIGQLQRVLDEDARVELAATHPTQEASDARASD